MKRTIAAATAFAACLVLSHGSAGAEESRHMRHIERPQKPKEAGPLYQGPPVPLPTREACEQAVRAVAGAYKPGGSLGAWLAADFPNREELLDALERVAPHATNVKLEVESVESVKIEPWRVDQATSTKGAQHIVSDCTADVRTRLTFEDPATGLRTVRDVGRAQWFLRYEQVVVH